MQTNLNDTQLYEEYNQISSIELCFYLQETVQGLIHKTTELIAHIRQLSYNCLLADHHQFTVRKSKFEEVFRTIESIFQRLRSASSVLHQRKLLLDKQVEEKHNQLNGNYQAQSQANQDQLKLEKEQLIEQIRLKNRYVKLAIDRVSDIIWQINSIQTLKQ